MFCMLWSEVDIFLYMVLFNLKIMYFYWYLWFIEFEIVICLGIKLLKEMYICLDWVIGEWVLKLLKKKIILELSWECKYFGK